MVLFAQFLIDLFDVLELVALFINAYQLEVYLLSVIYF